MSLTDTIKTVRALRKKEIVLESEINERKIDLAAVRKTIATLDKEIDGEMNIRKLRKVSGLIKSKED